MGCFLGRPRPRFGGEEADTAGGAETEGPSSACATLVVECWVKVFRRGKRIFKEGVDVAGASALEVDGVIGVEILGAGAGVAGFLCNTDRPRFLDS